VDIRLLRERAEKAESELSAMTARALAAEAALEAMRREPTAEEVALDMAWRVVDALGGTFDKSDPRSCGYDEALGNACDAISKLGAMEPAERRRRHSIA